MLPAQDKTHHPQVHSMPEVVTAAMCAVPFAAITARGRFEFHVRVTSWISRPRTLGPSRKKKIKNKKKGGVF